MVWVIPVAKVKFTSGNVIVIEVLWLYSWLHFCNCNSKLSSILSWQLIRSFSSTYLYGSNYNCNNLLTSWSRHGTVHCYTTNTHFCHYNHDIFPEDNILYITCKQIFMNIFFREKYKTEFFLLSTVLAYIVWVQYTIQIYTRNNKQWLSSTLPKSRSPTLFFNHNHTSASHSSTTLKILVTNLHCTQSHYIQKSSHYRTPVCSNHTSPFSHTITAKVTPLLHYHSNHSSTPSCTPHWPSNSTGSTRSGSLSVLPEYMHHSGTWASPSANRISERGTKRVCVCVYVCECFFLLRVGIISMCIQYLCVWWLYFTGVCVCMCVG